MDLWQLPTVWEHEGEIYPHRTDYREMLKLMAIFNDTQKPLHYRWLMALSYFYRTPIPRKAEEAAFAYLSDFLSCGQPGSSGQKLMDWQVDAPEILSGVNAAAGTEVRSLPYLHWWSFLSYFHSIGEGRLSQLVAIRYKLSRGQKLESYEQEFYRQNKDKIRLRAPESPADTAHRKSLEALLN